MNRPMMGPKSTLVAVCLALALLLTAAVSAGAAEVVVHYKKESLQEFEHQLNAGEIQAAIFNKKVRSIRLTLKNGEHRLVRYAKHQSKVEQAKLAAKHVSVTTLTTAQANKELKEKPKHHKLRYIVGGAVIVVILLVAAVLYINRRRKRD